MKKIILAAAFAAAGIFGASAQNANETMYLIKDDQVVGKYNVEDVDYLSFKLPDGVSDSNITLKVDNVGKNTVTYTVNTISPNTAYAHNIYTADYLDAMALSYEGDLFDNLEEGIRVMLMQEMMTYDAFLGIGSDSYTQTDYQLVSPGSTERFNVLSGNKYYLCGWEIDPVTNEPKEAFVYTTFNTLPGETSAMDFNCQFAEQNEYGIQFAFTGDSNVLYVRTAYGEKDMMEAYVQFYGIDFVLNAFGTNWDLSYLQGTGEIGDDISNSIWPAYDPGDYVMYARAYDANGDYKQVRVEVTAEGEQADGPQITINSKDKGEGYVSVNFEISPSNVEEAYVTMMDENECDDKLNMDFELWEIASGRNSIDITSQINTAGEYTYTNNEVPEAWQCILIYAKDRDGNKTTQRLSFYPDSETRWATYDPVYGAPARKAVKRIKNKLNPTISKK